MSKKVITIDKTERFDMSPWLYMQFMEPLGITDGSVEASWNHAKNEWYGFLIEATKQLSPPLMRWGGLLSAHYHWYEAVGERKLRKPMYNITWGGMESNQIGTDEFCDFCDQVDAEKLICVNFLSEARPWYKVDPMGVNRIGDQFEARDWVDYCNNPDNKLRIQNGIKKPHNVKLWQIGNETSYYDKEGMFTVEEAGNHTLEFANEMKKADSNISLIGWGDTGWNRTMMEIAGEHLDYLAFHTGPHTNYEGSVLKDNDYRADFDKTWDQLLGAWESLQTTLDEKREEIKGYDVKLAMTEGHFALRGRNRCEVLSSWAAGVANAIGLNIQERNGDILKIATLADFCGTNWMVNAIFLNHPSKKAHLMPVAHVMELYRKHVGEKGINVSYPSDIDVAASRTGNKIFLHIVNKSMHNSQNLVFECDGARPKGGKAYILQADPEWEIMITNYEQFMVKEVDVGGCEFVLPKASVAAIELEYDSFSI